MSKTSTQLMKESNYYHLYNICTYKNGYYDGGYYLFTVIKAPTTNFVLLHKFHTYVNSCWSSYKI